MDMSQNRGAETGRSDKSWQDLKAVHQDLLEASMPPQAPQCHQTVKPCLSGSLSLWGDSARLLLLLRVL